MIVNESQYMQFFQPGHYGSEDNAQGQKIEYKFKVSDTASVLLLNFTYMMQDAGYHDWYGNPYVDIRVLNAQGQLLDLGCYPNDYISNGNQNVGTAPGNPQWPYSRFFAQIQGSGSAQPFQTPSTLNGPHGKVKMQNCSASRIHNCNSSYSASSDEVKSFPYTIVAFNLNNYIGQTVILRYIAMGCHQTVHWAYSRFTAKMIPGKILAPYCGGDELNLSMPWGFDVSTYQWYNGTDSAHATLFYPEDASDPRVLPGSTMYHPKLMPDPSNPYFRCETESYTGVPFVYEATVNYYDLKPSFTVEPKALTTGKNCDLGVVLHNTSQIGIIRPDGQGGVDTTWQNLELSPEQCTWNFGDGTPEVHGFEPSHTYTQPGTYTISLSITDDERVCTSDIFQTTVALLPEYTEKQYATDTVSTCEGKLPYYYKPELFGSDNVQTKWDLNAVGDRQVNYSSALPQYNIRSWNGCDSIVKVRFDVLTPTVTIQQVGDFCDSAQTLLVAHASNVREGAVEYVWTFMDSVMSKTDELWAMSDGTYSVNIVDATTECEASTSYKIDPCVPNVFLPNCITPTRSINEGPVQNDYFYLDQFVLRFISEVKFTVYSRDGEQVFHYEGKKTVTGEFQPPTPFANLPAEMEGRMVLWDGKIHDRIIDGTYIYTLWIVSGGQTYLYKGRLMVM